MKIFLVLFFTTIIATSLGILVEPWIGALIKKWPDRNLTKIRFDSFLSFYRLAPDGWRLYKKTVEKKAHESYHSTATEYRFGFMDTLRYARWAKKEKARKQYEKDMSFLVDSVNADLAAYKKKAEAEVAAEIDKIAEDKMAMMRKYGL